MIDVDLRKWDYIEDQKEWELFKKTLTDKDINSAHDKLVAALKENLIAIIRDN